jgi:hypothetical protein
MSSGGDMNLPGQQLPMGPALGGAPEPFVPGPDDRAKVDAAARSVLAGDASPFAATFAATGVPGATIVPDPVPDALPHPTLRFLHGYWIRLKRGGGDLPDQRAVDPVEMRTALGFVLLLDVEPSGYDFRYRLYGSGVASSGAQDWTGWTVGAMTQKTRTDYGLFYRAVYRASLLSRRPVHTEHHSPRYLLAKAWQRIVLPLAGPDGGVGRFLVGNVPVGAQPLTTELRAELLRRVGPDAEPGPGGPSG